MGAHVGMLSLDLRLPGCRSLKEKRAVLKPIVTVARQRFAVAAAEVEHQDLHQRAGLVVAAVSGRAGHVEQILDEVERYVWSRAEVEVVSAERSWMEG